MKIIKKSALEEGAEMSLSLSSETSWQGFVLKGLPQTHQAHENKPKSLSAAVTIWNEVAPAKDRLSIKVVSARIINEVTARVISTATH